MNNTNNASQLHQHFDLLINHYSKILPLRLDFHYDASANKNPTDAYSDIFLLFHLARTSHQGILDFVFSIEESTTERLHIH